MSEFEQEVKRAEQELNDSLAIGESFDHKTGEDEFLGQYSQQIRDAASRAYDFANEKFSQAGDKVREISNKDPRELVEDAKEFARQKPGQTILISAAVGLLFGLLLKGRRR
jgi:ElaB/YqjD/DUF883 family membrane-anchored ribosome-binding protein